MRKVFYISFGLLILVLIFLGAYNFAFRNNVNSPVADPNKKEIRTNDQTKGTFQPATAITSPVNENLLAPVIGSDGTLYYYSLDDKSLKKSTLEGKNKTVLLSDFPGTPTRILWSPRKDKVLILLKAENGASQWYFAELGNRTLVPLKPEIGRLTWDNLGEKIFYQYTDQKSGEKTLNVANPDGSNWKTLTALGNRDSFITAIPKSTVVAFWNRPNALEKTVLESIGWNGDDRHTLLTDQFGADYLWSPSGDKILVSTSSEKGGNTLSLNLMNGQGGEYRSLSVPTLVSKVVWSKDDRTIYYALPGSLPENTVLPNDYFEKPLYTTDTFWKMDVVTGKKDRLVELKEVTQSFDATDFALSPDEDTLFFTDRQTHRLYRIEL